MSYVVDLRDRSIPACAGEPGYPPKGRTKETVYPRVCGGTSKARARGRYISGLSPRVRGNRELDPPRRFVARSIPACAGEPAGS